MRTLLALLLVTAAASPALAVDPGPTITPDFTPHPLEAQVKLKNGDVSVGDRFRGCGTTFTTEAPAYTFTLAEPMADLRVWIDSPAVLVFPAENSPYVCVKGGNAYFNDWPAGTYQVYLHGPSIGLGARIRIEMPARARAEADAARDAAPLLTLDPKAPQNPTYVTLPPGPPSRPELAGLGCGQPNVVPLARLAVPEDGVWTIVPDPGRVLRVVDTAGACRGKRDHTGAYPLTAGTYTLWGQLDDKVDPTAPWELEIAADERPLIFGDAPVFDLATVTTPTALHTTALPVTWGPTRRSACRRIPRTPSFYIDATESSRDVFLDSPHHLGPAPRMVVYGPIETIEPYRDWGGCDERTTAIIGAGSGTFAVFLVGQDATPGAPLVTVARQLGVRPDAMAAPLPIPEAPPLAERALERHYPYYGKETPLDRFFLEAPEQLFVYLTAPDGDAPADEPLALLGYGSRKSTVARFDGTRLDVATKGLSLDRPARIVLPKRPPEVEKAEDVDHAIALSGSEDNRLVVAYKAAEDKHHLCVQMYMEKHDPSWGKNYELIYTSSGRNVSDVWFRKADAACNYPGLQAKARKLTAEINRARQKRAEAYFKALKARFGA